MMDYSHPAAMLGFNKSHLTDDTFQSILSGIHSNAILESWSNFELPKGFGLIADKEKYSLAKERIVGLHAFELKFTLKPSLDVQSKIVVLKSKTTGQEVGTYFNNLSSGLEGPGLSNVWHKYVDQAGFFETDIKELLLVKHKDPVLNSIMPDIYWSLFDESNGVFVFAMEYIDPNLFTHIDSILDPSVWNEKCILDVLQGVAAMHCRYYNKISHLPENLRSKMFRLDKKYLMKIQPIVNDIFKINKPYCLESIWSSEDFDIIETIVSHMESIADILEKAPQTLIHNDFNIRNLCLRKEETLDKLKLCLYDWEFVAVGPPQQDVAECLTYFMKPESSLPEWDFYIEKYLDYFKKEFEVRNDDGEDLLNHYLEIHEFKKVFDMCMMVLAVRKHGAFISILERKIGFPHTKSFCQKGINYIKKIVKKYTFLA